MRPAIGPRRALVTVLLALLIVSAGAGAQPAARTARVGILWNEPDNAGAHNLRAFREGLKDVGWVEGRNLVLEYRYAEGKYERLPELAGQLVRLHVDVIFAPSSTFVRGAKQATTTVPIVFAIHNDPVGGGDVASLARPGGNITGLTQVGTDLTPKQMQLLREVVPRARRLAILWNPTTPSHAPSLPVATETARRLGLEPAVLDASNAQEFERAYDTAVRDHADAALILTSPASVAENPRLAQLALRRRLPTMHGSQAYAHAGGLMSYSAIPADLFRRAAMYVDKILKGAKPADLPVEQADRFELVINVRTARALGLTVPASLLVRADQVIE
jgi:putative ABC transport system substrate-binding protein